MDRLAAMQIFIRVAERCSFTAAADDLGLPRSTVSDAVKRLEKRLGVQLLQRTTRAVRPTLDGEAYYNRCLAILSDIEDAEGAFSGAKPQGLLRVNVHGALARHFILPHLPEFLETYPDIELFVSEGDRLTDLVREGIDCVIRVGILRDSDMIGRRLTLLEEVTLASPMYLKRFGHPSTPPDLHTGHQMVGFHSTLTGNILPLEFTEGGKTFEQALPVAVSVSAAESYVEAALADLGLIQIPRYHAEKYINAGRLVEILKENPPEPSPVSLLYPRNRQLSPRMRVFLDWVARRFAVADKETTALKI